MYSILKFKCRIDDLEDGRLKNIIDGGIRSETATPDYLDPPASYDHFRGVYCSCELNSMENAVLRRETPLA